jgi:hypothetical protein
MIAKISFTVKKPKGVSEADFVEWIKLNCGTVEQVNPENTMAGVQMEELIEQKNVRYRVKK